MNLVTRTLPKTADVMAPRSFLKASASETPEPIAKDSLASSTVGQEQTAKAEFALRKLCRDANPESLPSRFLAKVAQKSALRVSAPIGGLALQWLDEGPETMGQALSILDSLSGGNENKAFDLNMSGASVLLSETGPEAKRANATSSFLKNSPEHDTLVLRASVSSPAEIGLNILQELLPGHMAGREKELLQTLQGLESDEGRAKSLGQASRMVGHLPEQKRRSFTGDLLQQLHKNPNELPWEATLAGLKSKESGACWKEVLKDASDEELLSPAMRSALALSGGPEASQRLQNLTAEKKLCAERSQLALDALDLVPNTQQARFVETVLTQNSKQGAPIAKATAEMYGLAKNNGLATEQLETLLLRTGAEKSLKPLFEAGSALAEASAKLDAESSIDMSTKVLETLGHHLPDQWSQTTQAVKDLGETLETPERAKFYQQALKSFSSDDSDRALTQALKESFHIWAPPDLGYNADISGLPAFLGRLELEPCYEAFASEMRQDINQMGLTPETREKAWEVLHNCKPEVAKRVPTSSRKSKLRTSLEIGAVVGLAAVALGGFGVAGVGVLGLIAGGGGPGLLATGAGAACWAGGMMGVGMGALAEQDAAKRGHKRDWFECGEKLEV